MRNKPILLTTLLVMALGTVQAQTIELKKASTTMKISKTDFITLNNANPTYTIHNTTRDGYKFIVEALNNDFASGTDYKNATLTCNGIVNILEVGKGFTTCSTTTDIILGLPAGSSVSTKAFINYTLEMN